MPESPDTPSSEKLSIYQKLIEVEKAVDTVPKNGWNDFQKYEYVTEADLLRAVRGKLAELGVLVLTSVEGANRNGDQTEVTTVHTFIDAETGDKVEVKGYGQGNDKTDKGAPKAITGAIKSMLTKTFLIPTGDDPESDGSTKKPRARKPATPKPPVKPQANGTAHQNGNGKPAEAPPIVQGPKPATADQLKEIEDGASLLGLDKDKDIMERMGKPWPPDFATAQVILKRLAEKKKESGVGQRNGTPAAKP